MSGTQVVDRAQDVSVAVHVQEPGLTTVTVVGELDHSSESVLTAALAEAWDAWPESVTVDLREVTFVNARGLACLLRTSRTRSARGARLVLQCRPGLVARLLVLVGLARHVEEVLATDPAPARLELVSTPGPDGATPAPTRPRLSAVRATGAEPVQPGAYPGLRALPTPVVDRPATAAGPSTTPPPSRCPAAAGRAALVALDRALAGAGGDVECTRRAVLDHVLQAVPGAQHSSLTTTAARRSQGDTMSSSAAAADLAALQRRSGEGPVLDCIRAEAEVYTRDLHADQRWPLLARRAARGAAHSLLTFRLEHEGQRLGALSMHSDRSDAFGTDARELAGQLAARAATGLGNAQLRRALHRAVASRDVIGQAKGILMARHGLTADQAFDVLAQVSQQRNTPVVDLAEALARTGQL
ncbi:ANTAR domain-containing protein [Modestobacter sp. I12A-02628]|uniref:ANTAR domain-containing protein n=1 Tax=Goekera deserti TaxID=2497753 RepID=A0A7K3WE74_9ACTN|nr:ANTAR domain-containing protein [Goekera deserti]MPQ99567.1 ANTAR domain-containing protein [Goekera deserti]NDI46421.1 ANTAR domain-containing protein [Goekera deserti]NEL54646.1 ANTAR domain-containing protein [Goekera deserti]